MLQTVLYRQKNFNLEGMEAGRLTQICHAILSAEWRILNFSIESIFQQSGEVMYLPGNPEEDFDESLMTAPHQ